MMNILYMVRGEGRGWGVRNRGETGDGRIGRNGKGGSNKEKRRIGKEEEE